MITYDIIIPFWRKEGIMYIRELNIEEFNSFAENNEYSTYHQTVDYAILKASYGYEYEIIGYVDNDNNIYAAALVLVKLIDGYLYAYIPEGPLIDYSNGKLVNDFTESLIKYYKKEDIAFIKINPPIVMGTINKKTHERKYNDNYKLVDNLLKAGWTKGEDNLYFDSILPRISPIVDLDNYDDSKLNKNARNKYNKGVRKGLVLELGNIDSLKYLSEFTKKKTSKDDFYFNDYYNVFIKNHKADLFVVSIDYEKYTINSQAAYKKELDKNSRLKDKVIKKPGTRNINTKMNSDKTLLSYKEDIAIASKYLLKNEKTVIAAALVIKNGDTINIRISGYDKNFASFSPNYFLYHEILKYYHNEYKYADLNGMTGDLSKECKYHGLNQFKIGFNPTINEYAGEFDIIINKHIYNKLKTKGLLDKEFKNNK